MIKHCLVNLHVSTQNVATSQVSKEKRDKHLYFQQRDVIKFYLCWETMGLSDLWPGPGAWHQMSVTVSGLPCPLRDWECYRPHSVHNSSRSTSDMRTPEPEPEPGWTSQLCHLVSFRSSIETWSSDIEGNGSLNILKFFNSTRQLKNLHKNQLIPLTAFTTVL